MDRRQFVKNTGIALSALPLIPALSKVKNYKLALIGCGWWGMNILREAMAFGECKVVALCDVDQSARTSAQEEVKKLKGDQPKLYEDFREMLAQEKPEIVIVATPDHWHALCAIAAIKQGAHVYVEKPIGHTQKEGKAILRAARDNERTVQVGTHRRVSPHNISGMEFLRSGKVGKISQVKCFIYYGQGAGESVPDAEPPAGLNWDFWVGPAAETAYNPKIHPRGFRQFLNFANGTIGDWGIHWFDQVLWWTEERYPKRIFSTGDRYVRSDNTDAPDTQLAIFEFEDFTLNWEHRLCAPSAYMDHNVGCMFYGTEGTFHMGWLDGWTFYPKGKNAEIINVQPQLHDPDKQNIKELWANFRQSIESGERPVCDIEHGHLATNISMLGMISYKLGRSIEWDGEKEVILNDPEANKLLSRDYRGEWEYPV
ncbi:MAG: Gfo/Idh/MocA family oxidoreductase [Saprospiraceae bacterium]|nr:Gfo/Idh/MocA family oxidoreductase [Lewinella sp.]